MASVSERAARESSDMARSICREPSSSSPQDVIERLSDSSTRQRARLAAQRSPQLTQRDPGDERDERY